MQSRDLARARKHARRVGRWLARAAMTPHFPELAHLRLTPSQKARLAKLHAELDAEPADSPLRALREESYQAELSRLMAERDRLWDPAPMQTGADIYRLAHALQTGQTLDGEQRRRWVDVCAKLRFRFGGEVARLERLALRHASARGPSACGPSRRPSSRRAIRRRPRTARRARARSPDPLPEPDPPRVARGGRR